MAKNDHGKVDSTGSILDSLKEEALSDEQLSPQSEVKKKRDNKRFFDEICYLAMLDSIRLYTHLILLMRKQWEQKRGEAKPDARNIFVIRVEAARPLPLARAAPTERKKHEDKFKVVMTKLVENFKRIGNKIQSLQKAIEQKRRAIELSEAKSYQARQRFAKSWDHFITRQSQDPDFQGIKITIPAAQQIEFTMDQENYLQFGERVSKQMEAGTMQEFQAILKKSFSDFIQQKVKENEDLSPEERAQMDQDRSWEDELYRDFSQKILLPAKDDSALLADLYSAYELEETLNTQQRDLAFMEQELNQLTSRNGMVKELIAKGDVIEKQNQQAQQSNSEGAQEAVAAQMAAFNAAADDLLAAIKADEALLMQEKNKAGVLSGLEEFSRELSLLAQGKFDEGIDESQLLRDITAVQEKADILIEASSKELAVGEEAQEVKVEQEIEPEPSDTLHKGL